MLFSAQNGIAPLIAAKLNRFASPVKDAALHAEMIAATEAIFAITELAHPRVLPHALLIKFAFLMKKSAAIKSSTAMVVAVHLEKRAAEILAVLKGLVVKMESVKHHPLSANVEPMKIAAMTVKMLLYLLSAVHKGAFAQKPLKGKLAFFAAHMSNISMELAARKKELATGSAALKGGDVKMGSAFALAIVQKGLVAALITAMSTLLINVAKVMNFV